MSDATLGSVLSDAGITKVVMIRHANAKPRDLNAASREVAELDGLQSHRGVLKPGAPLLFIEHVLSEDDPGLAALQLRFNAMQMAMADGCHLDRKTLDIVRAAGFSNLEAVERFTLPGFGLISSQVSGIAIK